VALRAPEGRELKARLYLPNADWTGMLAFTFTLEASGKSAEAKKDFLDAKAKHYDRLLSRGIPGAAWFRHQSEEAKKALASLSGAKAAEGGSSPFPGRARETELEETYNTFTGGRALSENLQLDRLLAPSKGGEATVDVASLQGISVAAFDWKPLVKDLKPQEDPLAALIPADQHALFFPSFQAMLDLMDEADAHGTPILELLETRSEDARVRERYPAQLGLSVTDFARLFGPQVVASVAFTGSDPYLRMGSDLTVIFEAKKPEVLKAFLLSKQGAAAQASPGAKASEGEVAGIAFNAVVSPDRSISSYVASIGDAIAVTNSMEQLRRLAAVKKGEAPALRTLDEYIFFRNRYPRGDKEETAFLILTDATIRRWCGPEWRIADSRRTRAAALLAELQAAHLDEIASGDAGSSPIETSLFVPGAGDFKLTPSGVASAAYGTLEFMTPIAELHLAKVTQSEAEAYNRWRGAYQQYWRQFFDPIAVRFQARPEKIGADVTVLPLIEGTEYRQFIDLTRGAEISSDAGDPHPDSLVHFVMAINTKSRTVTEATNFALGMIPSLKTDPIGWLGRSIALYADADPVWDEARKAGKTPRFLEREFHRFPVALQLEVKDPLGVTVFLAALRAFIEQTAPGMTAWEALKYGEQPYVKVTPSEQGRSAGGPENLAIYYAVSPGALIFTLNESTLRRALDRQAARKKAKSAGNESESAASPWLGKSLSLQARGEAVDLVAAMTREEYQRRLQESSWGNLPILNEWRRLYPGEDPVALHQKLWKTKLVCPGGGSYAWNEKFQTMESTAYGHPGEPKEGPPVPLPLLSFALGKFGLTFEQSGLRARAELERKMVGKARE
jgi:hypothetical protein